INRFRHGVEHRQIQMLLAALARRYAADHLGAVGNRLLGVVSALRTGKALAENLGIFVDQNAHGKSSELGALGGGFHNLFSSVGQAGGGDDVQAAFGQLLRAELRVVAFQTNHDRYLHAHCFNRTDHTFGNQIAAYDTAEDIDQHRLHVLVGENDLEGFNHALLGSATTNVEEVRRLVTVQLDDVHGAHGQTGAVHHAADVAIE